MTVKLFSARNFLRHVRLGTLVPFVQNHAIWPRLETLLGSIPGAGSWQNEEDISGRVCDAVEALQAQQAHQQDLERDLLQWTDDLRRAHGMSGEAGRIHLRAACHAVPVDRAGAARRRGAPRDVDDEALTALQDLNGPESALWMLGERPQAFRDAELHLSFATQAEGRYWKRHRIPRQLPLTPDGGLAADRLARFGQAVGQLYKRSGAGQGVHLEWTRHGTDITGGAANSENAAHVASVQLTVYIEGPVTALSHFEHRNFTRGNARLALESALLYHPATGEVETIVKGGAKNHGALLSLFAEHLVGQPLEPQQVQAAPLQLDTLLRGLEPVEDWSHYGVRAVRLRRARLIPLGSAALSFCVEASNDPAAPDALSVARTGLQNGAQLEHAYRLDAATVVVHLKEAVGQRAAQFSFQIRACGRSTIRHLPLRHQATAGHVLRALQVIEHPDRGEYLDLGQYCAPSANGDLAPRFA